MFKEIVKRILLPILIWTEKRPKKTVGKKIPFWQKEIHIPLIVIITINIILIFIAVISEVGPWLERILGLILFLSLVCTLFIVSVKRSSPEMVKDNDAMMLLGLLASGSVLLIEAVKSIETFSPLVVPISGIAMLTVLLLTDKIAFMLVIVISLLCSILNGFKLEYFIFHFLGSLVGIYFIERVSRRQDIASTGLKIVMINMVTILMFIFLGYMQESKIFINIIWAVVNGVGSLILVLVLLYPLETFFSRITNIKLIELADFNQPVLKRLMSEAPGTYHHCLMVASLAERAAETINANSLLTRVGAYYHDIGKLIKPEYFVENQTSMGNPHETIPPSMSGLVVVSHVKEGVNLARKYDLDKPIINLIQEHHGTSLLAMFYRKALEKGKVTKEDEFRYSGPKPRTKESAILMLADACEAACRTIEEATHGRVEEMVKKIVNNKFIDGQFDDSPITLSDLNRIANNMITTLTGIHHARIEYKETVSDEKQKQVRS